MIKTYISITLIICLTNTHIVANQLNNDFNRRYNANSHILNTPVYYNSEKSTAEKQTRHAERRKTPRMRKTRK